MNCLKFFLYLSEEYCVNSVGLKTLKWWLSVNISVATCYCPLISTLHPAMEPLKPSIDQIPSSQGADAALRLKLPQKQQGKILGHIFFIGSHLGKVLQRKCVNSWKAHWAVTVETTPGSHFHLLQLMVASDDVKERLSLSFPWSSGWGSTETRSHVAEIADMLGGKKNVLDLWCRYSDYHGN